MVEHGDHNISIFTPENEASFVEAVGKRVSLAKNTCQEKRNRILILKTYKRTMTSIRRKLFFLLTALLALPMQAQVNLVYVDSARVARLLAEDAGLVAAPVAEVADTDTVPLADRPVVADGADFDRLWTDSFADRMAAIVEDPLLQSTQMAVMVRDLSADQCVYRFNEAQRMRPASVQKCVTAITALDRLGVDYQFSTRLYCRGDIDSTGVLHGSLYCVGGMDPSLATPICAPSSVRCVKKGIRRITGDLLADKSMKDDKPMGEGWCWDDDDSNPPLSPLLYNRRDRFRPNSLAPASGRHCPGGNAGRRHAPRRIHAASRGDPRPHAGVAADDEEERQPPCRVGLLPAGQEHGCAACRCAPGPTGDQPGGACGWP